MAGMLALTPVGGSAQPAGQSIVSALGSIHVAVSGSVAAAKSIRLTLVPNGPETDETSALTTGEKGTGSSVDFTADAYGAYRWELWEGASAGTVSLVDTVYVVCEDADGMGGELPYPLIASKVNMTEARGRKYLGYWRRVHSKMRKAIKTIAAPTLWFKSKQHEFNLSDYGVVGDGSTDNITAINNCLADIEALTPNAESTHDARGAVIKVPFGLFYCSDTIRLKRQIRLIGVGGGLQGGSVFKFPAGKDGIVVERYNDGSFGNLLGAGSSIEHIGVAGPNSWSAGNKQNPPVNGYEPLTSLASPLLGHGIVCNDRCFIKHCYIAGFRYDGIVINSVPGHINANVGAVENTRINSCGRHGVYLAGINSNVWRFASVDATLCAGWGFYSRAFLGNKFDAVHAAECGYYAGDVKAVHIVPTLKRLEIWAGMADGGAFRSLDGGRIWQAFDAGMHLLGVNLTPIQFAYASGGSAGQRTFAATSTGGVFRFDELNGLPFKWAARNGSGGTALGDLNCTGLIASGSTLYAATPSGVYKSTDLGATWAITGFTSAAYAVGFDKDGNILAGGSSGTSKSTNGGTSFSSFDTSSQVTSFAVKGDRILIGTTSGVRYSTNNGSSFSGALTGAVPCVAIGSDNDFYAGQSDGVHKSTNDGSSWSASNGGSPNNLGNTDVRALAASDRSDQADSIYLGVHLSSFSYSFQTAGVFRSDDGGGHWHGAHLNDPIGGNPNTPDLLNARRTFYGGGFKSNSSTVNPDLFAGSYIESDEINGNEINAPGMVIGGVAGYNGIAAQNTGAVMTGDSLKGVNVQCRVTPPVVRVVRDTLVAASSFDTLSVDSNAERIFVDGTNGKITLILPDPTGVTAMIGRRLTINRLDDGWWNLWIQVANSKPIIGVGNGVSGTRITVDNTGVDTQGALLVNIPIELLVDDGRYIVTRMDALNPDDGTPVCAIV